MKPTVKALFLSDIHLRGSEDPHYLRLLDLLHTLKEKNITDLFLVGDIFDLWLGRHQIFIKNYSQLIQKIEELTKAGVRVHYFEGNHDLYLKRFWPQLGVQVYPGPKEFQFEDVCIRVEHGDEFDPKDFGYLFLRWFLRTPIMQLAERILPDGLVHWIGQKSSHASRHYTSQIKTMAQETGLIKIRDFAERRAKQSKFDILIFGHVHIRDEYQFEEAGLVRKSINLGSWLTAPCYYMLEGRKGQFFELK